MSLSDSERKELAERKTECFVGYKTKLIMSFINETSDVRLSKHPFPIVDSNSTYKKIVYRRERERERESNFDHSDILSAVDWLWTFLTEYLLDSRREEKCCRDKRGCHHYERHRPAGDDHCRPALLLLLLRSQSGIRYELWIMITELRFYKI